MEEDSEHLQLQAHTKDKLLEINPRAARIQMEQQIAWNYSQLYTHPQIKRLPYSSRTDSIKPATIELGISLLKARVMLSMSKLFADEEHTRFTQQPQIPQNDISQTSVYISTITLGNRYDINAHNGLASIIVGTLPYIIAISELQVTFHICCANNPISLWYSDLPINALRDLQTFKDQSALILAIMSLETELSGTLHFSNLDLNNILKVCKEVKEQQNTPENTSYDQYRLPTPLENFIKKVAQIVQPTTWTRINEMPASNTFSDYSPNPNHRPPTLAV